ncbi:DNA-binding LacI/PurR family transcriptional regulator [Microbacterium natoriense]|uniref:DNA-binding LacI/PurR family transcriptional regulator n=1 Tax=Microbacterium natoriense TaxID=284570 RepID=A0AAW8ETL3_9MICO|nr:LacI family DNA-binding transcriptional regulator [Microbacterium natoriense]MDQ0646765.1 DNA-binding LacI/PurR family transcriptional regulator [Microbacterium natoriense]
MVQRRKTDARRPTLRMVAELAGVSTATVSYVFSGRAGTGGSGVAEATAARVIAAAEELNYRPNTAARAIRTGRSGMVQLSLHMLSDPWSLAVADAVNAEANKHGLTTLILADGDWHAALDRVESDVAYLDGVGLDEVAKEKLRDLVRRGQRLVVFSEHLEPDGFDVVRSDAIPGCELAMDHLIERRTRIGCLAAEGAVRLASTQVTRYTPYVEKMSAAGLVFDPAWTETYAETQASAFAAAVRLLSSENRPDAVYATTDFAAIAAINAAHMLGLRVPHDVAVVGVGNTPDARLIAPTLTTVGPTDFYERQARIIIERALSADDVTGRLHEFSWSLFPGASTDIDAPASR